MKIFLLSPETVPPNPHLFPTFINEFEKQGHSFVDRIEEADCCFMDLHTRIADYNQSDIDYILGSEVPIAVWDEWDRLGMSEELWPMPLTGQQVAIFEHISRKDINVVHFCRLMDSQLNWPKNVFPYEKPIIHEEPPVSADDLFNRPYDIVWIANNAPQRETLEQELRNESRLNCYISLGQPKIPFNEWVDWHKKGKFFITCSGGGATDERMQALFSVSTILKERTDQLLHRDFEHMESCLRFDIPVTMKDLNDICRIARDKEALHQIYMDGYNFVKSFYSQEYMASRYISILNKHGIV